MNIFVLHPTPRISAQYHCDKHVVKMILEYAQMLSTAHRVLDGEQREIYVKYYRNVEREIGGKIVKVRKLNLKKRKTWVHSTDEFIHRFRIELLSEKVFDLDTHINHPCSKWVRDSYENYVWLYELFNELLNQYKLRYKKWHKKIDIAWDILSFPKNIPYVKGTPFPLAMPDEYKTNDPVQSYRNFYLGDKMEFAKWNHSEPPFWVNQSEPYVVMT